MPPPLPLSYITFYYPPSPSHLFSPQWHHVEPADVVIIEGILVLHMERIR